MLWAHLVKQIKSVV